MYSKIRGGGGGELKKKDAMWTIYTRSKPVLNHYKVIGRQTFWSNYKMRLYRRPITRPTIVEVSHLSLRRFNPSCCQAKDSCRASFHDLEAGIS